MVTVCLQCECGALFSIATYHEGPMGMRVFDDFLFANGDLGDWVREHLPHNEIENGELTFKTRLLGHAG